MAGNKCIRKFWDAVSGVETKRGTICKIGKRDKVINEKGSVKYVLWDTPIAKANKKTRRVTLDTGGWGTKLTKDRMNRILAKKGKSIRQKQHSWFINGKRWTSAKFTVK